ncbi:MAG: glutaredoxin family protein [Patescibacteria group bacterium]|jgi:glutaredoxin-like YruB-family protein|nr:glutaredoxin family protein [Patescibacteria group bacterium]
MNQNIDKKVILYTTPTCVFCKNVKEYFAENNIKYELVDLAESRDRVQEMVDKSGQMGVPVIDAGGEIVVGFDKPKLDKIFA